MQGLNTVAAILMLAMRWGDAGQTDNKAMMLCERWQFLTLQRCAARMRNTLCLLVSAHPFSMRDQLQPEQNDRRWLYMLNIHNQLQSEAGLEGVFT